MYRQIQVKNIFMYPIKACGAYDIAQAQICKSGLKDPWSGVRDREFAVISNDGQALTMRDAKLEVMCLIKTELNKNTMGVFFRDESPLELSLDGNDHEPLQFSIHRKSFAWGYDQGERVSRWFSKVLKTPCRLVRYADNVPRVKYTKEGRLYYLTYGESNPLLIINLKSIQALFYTNSVMDIDMLRFRPNIVFDGAEPNEENTWRKIETEKPHGIQLVCNKPCERCAVVNVDPRTGTRTGGEILKSLTGKKKSHAIFGYYYLPEKLGVVISRTDKLYAS